jgi:hypothetical protein
MASGRGCVAEHRRSGGGAVKKPEVFEFSTELAAELDDIANNEKHPRMWTRDEIKALSELSRRYPSAVSDQLARMMAKVFPNGRKYTSAAVRSKLSTIFGDDNG